MKAAISGRLDRSHYWMVFVGIVIAKLAWRQIAGNTGSIGFDVVLLGILIARFHDFAWPTWTAVSLWIVFSLALPLAIMIGTGDTSQETQGLASLPAVLLHLVAGLISGNRDANAYGSPGQGFGGLNRRTAPSTVAAASARRIAAVTGRR